MFGFLPLDQGRRERIETLEQLRNEIGVGIRELDAGLGEELDIDKVIEQAHREHARKT